VLRDVDDAPIAWREAGEGPLVLFLHGLGATRTSWDAQLAELADDYRCVAWDLPGYGRSEPLVDLSLEAAADAAAALIDRLGGSAHIVGLSMGGMIGMHLALRHPTVVRSLAIVDSSPAFGMDGTDPEEWRAARLAPLDAGAQVPDFAEPVLRGIMGPNVSDEAVAAAVASMLRVPLAGLRETIAALPEHDVRARLGDIGSPTLVVVGELDEETPPAYSEAIAGGIPGARLAVIPGVGHYTSFEAPDALNALLRDHLDMVEAA
jgi:3-oxoadipate enol-lactonase